MKYKSLPLFSLRKLRGGFDGCESWRFYADRIYFITYTIFRRISIFRTEKYFDLIYDWFDYMKTHYDNKINGYIIMPNHLHLLLYISEYSPDVSRLVKTRKDFILSIVKYFDEDNRKAILKIFSAAAEKEKGAKHKVFEDRFDSKEMVNSAQYKEKLNYIHNNLCTSKRRLAENLKTINIQALQII